LDGGLTVAEQAEARVYTHSQLTAYAQAVAQAVWCAAEKRLREVAGQAVAAERSAHAERTAAAVAEAVARALAAPRVRRVHRDAFGNITHVVDGGDAPPPEPAPPAAPPEPARRLGF
jgi:hypothetical protein